MAAQALVCALLPCLLALNPGLMADEHPRAEGGDQPPQAEQGAEASPAAAMAAAIWAPTPLPAAVPGSSPFPRLFYSAADAPQGCEEEPGALSSWFAGLGYDPLLNEDIVAYYGKPGARVMGILGRMDKDAAAKALSALCAEYDARNGERTVRAGFYLIYGTVWPGGDIGILGEATTREWVEWALSRGIIVFLDHQIGKYSVEAAVKRLLPWLAYPNVHLALDPEWRTERPMEEIGTVKGEELNAAQALIQAYMVERGLPGRRMLVVHQFKPRMISNRDSVRADFDRVLLVHTADGFGHPAVKLEAYRQNARGTNIPVKGYKLFYKSGYQGAGYDDPLMSPDQVMSLDPRPALIMYQ
jgi:hypothetical protein